MDRYPKKQENWQTGQRSTACYEREITKLKEQRGALLEACEELITAPAIRMAIKALRDIGHEGIGTILQARIDKAKAAIASTLND